MKTHRISIIDPALLHVDMHWEASMLMPLEGSGFVIAATFGSECLFDFSIGSGLGV